MSLLSLSSEIGGMDKKRRSSSSLFSYRSWKVSLPLLLFPVAALQLFADVID